MKSAFPLLVLNANHPFTYPLMNSSNQRKDYEENDMYMTNLHFVQVSGQRGLDIYMSQKIET